MKNLAQMMREAQAMQEKIAQYQSELASREITGAAGAGQIAVTLNGKGEMRKLAIDKSLVVAEESDVLEDLIVAAHNDAKSKLEAQLAEDMAKITGGLKLPGGLKFPF
jgi:DNA-binding YbaB/EbfC family protein